MSPFHAWIYLKGLETLRLRMHAHCASTLELATWLEAHPAVAQVYYPGLVSHPQHALAAQQQTHGGGVLSFEVKGGREAAWKIIDATRLLSITATFGDSKTTITHPASTTHSRLSSEARAAAGITEGLIRIGVGLEDVDDIKADLQSGLASG
jgi:O-succinylhomoserine sulfhydrylase